MKWDFICCVEYVSLFFCFRIILIDCHMISLSLYGLSKKNKRYIEVTNEVSESFL